MIEPQNNQVQVVEDDRNSFLDYLIVLAKHSRMIIFVSAGVTVLTYLVLFVLPNNYTAAVRIFPPQQKMSLSAHLLNSLGGLGAPGGPAAGSMGGMASSFLGLKTQSELYADVMVGNTISDRIIERFQLRQLYKAKYIEDARQILKQRVGIQVDRKDGVITVGVTDKDPKRAAEIANAFPQELDKLLQGLTTQEASTRLAFLEKERSQLNQSLALAENALRAFSEKNSVLQIDTQTRGVLEYIARLRAEIDAKEVQVQVMRQQATPSNYDMVRLETEVKGLKSKLKTAESQYGQVSVGDAYLTSSEIPALGLEYMRLYREVKFQEGLYQFYIKMVELARLDMVKEGNVVQLIDQALPPEKRANTRLLPALLTGMVMFIIMVILAFMQEYWQKAMFNEKDTQRLAILKSYFQPFSRSVKLIRSRFGR